MNFRKIMTGLLMVLGLLVGGLTASTPATAQAQTVSQEVTSDVAPMDYGTWVRFEGNWAMGDEISPNAHLRIWTMNGAYNHIGIGDNARNVAKVCPPDHDHRLAYVRPSGSIVDKNWGECQDMTYAASGTYKFYLEDRD